MIFDNDDLLQGSDSELSQIENQLEQANDESSFVSELSSYQNLIDQTDDEVTLDDIELSDQDPEATTDQQSILDEPPMLDQLLIFDPAPNQLQEASQEQEGSQTEGGLIMPSLEINQEAEQDATSNQDMNAYESNLISMVNMSEGVLQSIVSMINIVGMNATPDIDQLREFLQVPASILIDTHATNTLRLQSQSSAQNESLTAQLIRTMIMIDYFYNLLPDKDLTV